MAAAASASDAGKTVTLAAEVVELLDVPRLSTGDCFPS